MAIRTKKFQHRVTESEVRAVKITEKNLEDVVDYILRNGGAANGRLARPEFKRPARIRIKQWNHGRKWAKKDWRVALIGDWIVRYEDGTFARVKAGTFDLYYIAL